MLSSKVGILILLFSIVAVSASEFQSEAEKKPEARIIGGTPTEDGKLFPYYTVIRAYDKYDNLLQCGATILDKQWICTLKKCVGDAVNIAVDFKFFNSDISKTNYTVQIKNPKIYHWPVGDYAISLLELPISLLFNSETGPVAIAYYFDSSDFSEPLIMPGIERRSDGYITNSLSYGIFKAASPEKCSSLYGTSFDSYWQICVEGWEHLNNYACNEDLGSGLVSNWKYSPNLVGLLSLTPQNCNNNSSSSTVRAITNIERFSSWIYDITGEYYVTTPYRSIESTTRSYN